MTNYLSNKSRRSVASGKSGGGTMVQILTFVGATVIILGAVIAYEKKARTRTRRPDEPTSAQSVGTLHNDDYYKSRGLQPNTPTSTPTTEQDTRTPRVTPEPEATPEAPSYLYVGRSDWNRYHRLDCKYAKQIPEDNLVGFHSAAEALSKGYIPCKICKPPVQSADATLPHPSRPTPTPVKRPAQPIRLPITDVAVSFPFQVTDREVITERGVIRVELTAQVEKPLSRDNILLLARKLVAAEIRKQDVNAVSIIMQKKTIGGDPVKWICWVDWAPYGNLVRANEVKPGDYDTHQFDIFQHGTIHLKR